jgi:hypothetical protein
MHKVKTSFQIGTIPYIAEWMREKDGKTYRIISIFLCGNKQHDITQIIMNDSALYDIFAGHLERIDLVF